MGVSGRTPEGAATICPSPKCRKQMTPLTVRQPLRFHAARLGRCIDAHRTMPSVIPHCARRCHPTTAPRNASIRPNQLRPPAFRHLADGRARIVAVSRADEYRRRAQQCLEMARRFGDRDARVTLSHMAQAWLRLADRTAPEQKRPIVQQRQQVQPKNEKKE